MNRIEKNVMEMANTRRNIVNTPYGSLVQTFLILNGITWTDGEFVKKFKKAQLPFLEDEQFMQKTLSAVGLKYEDLVGKPVLVCESNYNTIFSPFITNDGEIMPLPLFADAQLTYTQELAMDKDTWHIIDWEE